MEEKEITALAREYAEKVYAEIEDVSLKEHLIVSLAKGAEDSFRFLLRRYCLVEKEEVRKEYEPVKDTSEECNYEELGATWDEAPYLITFYDVGYKCGQKETIESLFPEIAKEVEG